MASVGIYLNFSNEAEEAFSFYKSVFGGEFVGGISRFSDVPPSENMPPISEEDKKLVMHVGLPILGGQMLMGCDVPASMGVKVNNGNNVYINLAPDSREETEQLFKALSEGGNVEMDLQDTFWGAYFASFTDKFGVHWMINFENKA